VPIYRINNLSLNKEITSKWSLEFGHDKDIIFTGGDLPFTYPRWGVYLQAVIINSFDRDQTMVIKVKYLNNSNKQKYVDFTDKFFTGDQKEFTAKFGVLTRVYIPIINKAPDVGNLSLYVE
jgi:hypothetical protein